MKKAVPKDDFISSTNSKNGRTDRSASSISIDSLEEVYVEHREALHRHALKIVGDTDAADDAVQQALERTVWVLSSGREIEAIKSWLYTCVGNCAINHVRKRDRIKQVCLEDRLEQLSNGQESFEKVDQLGCTKEIFKAASTLPKRQQSVFGKTQIQGKSYTQTAAEMGTSTESVRQLMYRARRQVRNMLADKLSALGPAIWTPVTFYKEKLSAKLWLHLHRYLSLSEQSGLTLQCAASAAAIAAGITFVLGGAFTNTQDLDGNRLNLLKMHFKFDRTSGRSIAESEKKRVTGLTDKLPGKDINRLHNRSVDHGLEKGAISNSASVSSNGSDSNSSGNLRQIDSNAQSINDSDRRRLEVDEPGGDHRVGQGPLKGTIGKGPVGDGPIGKGPVPNAIDNRSEGRDKPRDSGRSYQSNTIKGGSDSSGGSEANNQGVSNPPQIQTTDLDRGKTPTRTLSAD